MTIDAMQYETGLKRNHIRELLTVFKEDVSVLWWYNAGMELTSLNIVIVGRFPPPLVVAFVICGCTRPKRNLFEMDKCHIVFIEPSCKLSTC